VRWSPKLVVAVVDARRGEVFTAKYRQVPGGIQRLDAYRVTSPNDLMTDLLVARDDLLLVGDGAVRYERTFAQAGRIELTDQGLAYPSPSSLVQLAHAKALREEFVNTDLQPLYLRPPDAAINWTTRDGKGPNGVQDQDETGDDPDPAGDQEQLDGHSSG
jgi:tRNA threonylcarbamoyladenosine biosynthesis protein TsaB